MSDKPKDPDVGTSFGRWLENRYRLSLPAQSLEEPIAPRDYLTDAVKGHPEATSQLEQMRMYQSRLRNQILNLKADLCREHDTIRQLRVAQDYQIQEVGRLKKQQRDDRINMAWLFVIGIGIGAIAMLSWLNVV